MLELKQSDIHIAFNDHLGLVYHVNKGRIKVTDSNHAVLLKTAFSDYINGRLKPEDSVLLEKYIMNEFSKHPSREIVAKESTFKNSEVLNKLEILIANDCNLRCKYCYAQNGTYGRKKRIMQPSEAIEYLNRLLVGRYRRIDTVMFFGGEPTLQPQTIATICSFFEYHVQHGTFESIPHFTLVSNGTLIDDSLAIILKRHSISTLWAN